MTGNEFMQRDVEDQAVTVWHNGVQIGARTNAVHTIRLYQIEGFYVEVFYHRETNGVARLRCFRSTGQRRPYLDQISIANLGL